MSLTGLLGSSKTLKTIALRLLYNKQYPSNEQFVEISKQFNPIGYTYKDKKFHWKIGNKRKLVKMSAEMPLSVWYARGKDENWKTGKKYTGFHIQQMALQFGKKRNDPEFKDLLLKISPKLTLKWLNALSYVRFGETRSKFLEKTKRSAANKFLEDIVGAMKKIHYNPSVVSESLYRRAQKKAEHVYGIPLQSDEKLAQTNIQAYWIEERKKMDRTRNLLKKLRRRVLAIFASCTADRNVYKHNPELLLDAAKIFTRLHPRENEIPAFGRAWHIILAGVDLHFQRYDKNQLADLSLFLSMFEKGVIGQSRKKLQARAHSLIGKIADELNENFANISPHAMMKSCVALSWCGLYDHALFDSVAKQVAERPGFLFTDLQLRELVWAFLNREAKSGIETPYEFLDTALFELLLETRRKFLKVSDYAKLRNLLEQVGIFHPGVCQQILQLYSPTPGQSVPRVRTYELVKTLKWLFDNLQDGETLLKGPVTVDVIYFTVRRLRYVLSNELLKSRRSGPLLKKFHIAQDFLQSCLNAGLHDKLLVNMIVRDMKYAYFDPRPLLQGLHRLSNPPVLPDDYFNVCKQDLKYTKKHAYYKRRVDIYAANIAFYENELEKTVSGKLDEGLDANEQAEGLRDLIVKETFKLNAATKRFTDFVGYGERRLKSRIRKFGDFKKFLEGVPLVDPQSYEYLNVDFNRSYELADWWNKHVLDKIDIELEGEETKEIMELRRKRVDKELKVNRERKFWNQLVDSPPSDTFEEVLLTDYDTEMSEIEEVLGALNDGEFKTEKASDEESDDYEEDYPQDYWSQEDSEKEYRTEDEMGFAEDENGSDDDDDYRR